MKLAAFVVISLMTCGVAAAVEQDQERRLQMYTLLTSRISADEWKIMFIQINNDGTKGEIYSISNTREPQRLTKGVYRVWLRTDYSPTRSLIDEHFDFTLEQMDFDCDQYRNRSVSTVWYELVPNEAAQLVISTTDDLEWHSVVPGSVGESELKGVCKELGFKKNKD